MMYDFNYAYTPPATPEDIAEMQAALAAVVQDPNLTIGGPPCDVCNAIVSYGRYCICGEDKIIIYLPSMK